MRIILFLLLNVLVLFLLFSIARKIFSTSTPLNIKLFISMMFFGGIGFAFGHHFSDGWAIFGSIFGVLVGIEYKDHLFRLLHMLYRDITED